MPKKVTIEEWKAKAREKHDDYYDYSMVSFLLVHDRVTIICPKHGSFSQKAYSHTQGKGCRVCANQEQSSRKTKTLVQFIEHANRVHGRKYDYSQVDYVHKDKKVIVICRKHGAWSVTPGNHINGRSGCPECYHEYTSKRQKGKKRPGIGGVSAKTQEQFLLDCRSIHGDRYRYDKVIYKSSRVKVTIVCEKHGEFSQLPSAHLQGEGCPECICNENRSCAEREIAEMVESWGFTIETSNRSIIKLELDIVVPDHKIAIEYCGLYWHSEKSKSKDRKYHVGKCDLAEQKGYQLITIFEDEWETKRNIVVGRLKYALKKGDRGPGARLLDIGLVEWKHAKSFLNKYHIQGSGQAGYKRYGAYMDGVLIGVMTFCRPRAALGRKSGYPELLRFCTDGKNYPGLASRMFRAFLREEDPDGVVSYADRRWSLGGLYRSLGFKEVNKTEPNYWYSNNYKDRTHRYAFRKQKVLEMGGDPNLSEWKNMQAMGYDRIWDCGNLKFIWTR